MKQPFKSVRPSVLLPSLLITILASVLLLQLPAFSAGSASKQSQDARAYRQQLQSQVESADGTPREGRNPATQKQSGLMAAASVPAGAGSRTDRPAAGVQGTVRGSADAHAGHNQRPEGVTSAGCLVDYGKPGEQCVSADLMSSQGTLSCAAVRKQFDSGVKVSGTDRFRLDTNSDKIACGRGDR
ncbi:MAG TPA: hypothetical protein VK983_04810 [Candidatus Limnocylindrales bacterium]|nr:hypothetical protein [Candidatus Limnocylindrales bacterium]